MSGRSRSPLTFANVTSLLALVIALGTGTAYAADTVGSSDIIDGAVMNVDLGADAVDASKILDGSIGTADIADGSVTGSDVAPDSLTGSDIADHAVGVRDLKGSDHHENISVGAVAAGRCVTTTKPAAGAKAGDAAVLTTDGPIPSGMVIFAQRATINHVQIKVCNMGAAASLPINGLPVRVVTIR